ncbi:C40 family peptidase [Cohnella nanjingensis]|uniref:C40 family peptidase n=1 Tax=Cohnella nanjingensis TaxID=1387779 RepID=A0A7X0RNJ4_9BACL|nr:C40 family peptidase [Cohnella nanjingensis]MBB6670558.1 C40 family peptidase [Cohnella nanjingensis]
MRKVSVLILALTVFLAVQAGVASAATKLDSTVSKLIGIDYDYGGTTTNGFDCSGFTSYVFKKFDLKLPHSSKEQFSLGDKVERDDLRPGDLVFFNTSGSGVSHVGIYVGDNKFAHSASKGVTISDLDEKYYAKRYLGARRVMDSDTYKDVAIEHV